MPLRGVEVGVQVVSLELVRDGSWRGRGIKVTYLCPTCPLVGLTWLEYS